MKRYTMSDMDSECDDVFTDDSKCTSAPDEGGCHMINRKRRRGIIEKRRRDRINSSLTELRRLVPAAFEKQGSAKLEKAEILQMTVDHLKILHTKGLDPFGFEPHHFAMDYHGIGFRECAAEVARYLVAMEGMDLQDPLRMRLMSHLQCFAAQRDLAIKSTTPSSAWSPMFTSMTVTPASRYSPGPPPVASSPLSARTSTSLSYSGDYGSTGSETRLSHRSSSSMSSEATSGSPPVPNNSVSRLQPLTSTTQSPVTPTPIPTSHLRTMAGTSPPLSGYLSGQGYPNLSAAQREPTRPYRPWGTELAY